jgi:Skp family chaperone for outer membrane proteins
MNSLCVFVVYKFRRLSSRYQTSTGEFMQGRKTARPQHFLTALGACALALGLAAGAPQARAADAPNIGILDEVKLGDNYTKYRTAVDELNQRAKKLEEQLRARAVLNETEGKRFDELFSKPEPTEKETAELDTLIKTGVERGRTYLDLTGKAERTPDEDKLIKDVEANKKANALTLAKLEDSMFQELQTRERATDKQYIELANIEVQKVAADKKLVAVLRKDAVAWFSPSVDITDEVLKRLNNK